MNYSSQLEKVLRAASGDLKEDETISLLLEYFSDRVDGRIQEKLVSDLMTRYAETSSQLEENNRQLIRSDLRRREAQKTAMLGDWELNIAKQTVEWSESMAAILELDPTQPPDIDLYYRMVHPQDLKRVKQGTNKLLKGILPKEYRHRLVTENGREKWVRVQHSLRVDSEGKAIAIRGTIQDITKDKTLEDKLKKYNTQLEKMVQEKVAEISESNMATIYALVKLSESRDDETGTHIERTAFYCKFMAEMLREQGIYETTIDDEFIHSIAMASPLHDIGKVGIPDAILLKPGKLTTEEFEVMKTHVSIGYRTMVGLEKRYPANAMLNFGMIIVRYHHEKWDGSGYMKGLAGENIPLSARIMALADVYDALRSRHVYKEPYTHEEALEIILKGSGTHFDPAIINVFSKHHLGFQEIFDSHS